jgi:small subunit ribosomal protein S16
MGTKGRPFYRVVVAHSTAGRNGKFVESIGTYDPQSKPKLINIDGDRALHWLVNGAQPSETTAYLLNKIGVLEKYFEQRPTARKNFSFLDKRTAAISVPSAIEPTPAPAAKKAEPEPAPAPAPEPEALAEAPAAEEAPVEEVPAAEEAVSEDTAEADASASGEAAAEEAPAESSEEAEKGE